MSNKIAFRNNHPSRRTAAVKPKHTDYFHELREDFNARCGYCDSFDLRRSNDFEIDHYRPRRVLVNIKHNDYFNLVYSCKACNRTKRGTWPSDNEDVLKVGHRGFVDPIDSTYHTNFSRYDNGEIDWETQQGKWMYMALGLFNTQHAVLWFLEKLRNAINEGKLMKQKFPDSPVVMAGQLALYELEEVFLNKLFDVSQ